MSTGARRNTTTRCGKRCADAERDALLAALDGKRVPAGPAGAPQRGRRDVLPTGRNLYHRRSAPAADARPPWSSAGSPPTM